MPVLAQAGPRRPHTVARLAWSLWALAMTLLAVAVPLWLANHAVLVSRFGATEDFAPHVFLVPGYATVGAVIAARRRSRVGWLFLGFGLVAAWLSFASAYFMRGAVVAPGSLPAARLAGWIGPVLWPCSYLLLALGLLLFPDGRLPSPRWRPVALTLGIMWGSLIIYFALEPATSTVHGVAYTNPLGIQALGDPAWRAVANGAGALSQAALAAAALAPLVRFRRADQLQRQQLKWFAFVVGSCVASVVVALAVSGFLPTVAGTLITVAFVGVLVGLPVAVGLAILRYRLYDIDRLINRTLVYSTLTAVLGLGYAGTVLALGQLFGGVGERTPSWVVAGATLATAAMFQPVRHRIQAVVDRRFNRRKYDAAKTVEAFSVRLRDEVDLDALSAELLAVVHQSMQPTAASLWLQPSARSGREAAKKAD
jgi:hypothetical protein